MTTDPDRRDPRPVRGYFVDEIYTEDADEASRLEDAEAMRAARMLGCVLAGAMLLIVGIGAVILWRALVG